MIQGCDSSSLKKDMLSKESGKSTCWIVVSTSCFTLSVFEKNLKKLEIGWPCCQANSTNCFVFSNSWFLENLTKFC